MSGRLVPIASDTNDIQSATSLSEGSQVNATKAVVNKGYSKVAIAACALLAIVFVGLIYLAVKYKAVAAVLIAGITNPWVIGVAMAITLVVAIYLVSRKKRLTPEERKQLKEEKQTQLDTANEQVQEAQTKYTNSLSSMTMAKQERAVVIAREGSAYPALEHSMKLQTDLVEKYHKELGVLKAKRNVIQRELESI